MALPAYFPHYFMSKSLLLNSRVWHRKIASVLFIFFFFISLTGTLLAWKSAFTKTILENKTLEPSTALHAWLPVDSLEIMAVKSLNEKIQGKYKHAEKIELKPSKGYISFSFKNYYTVQLDGATGIPLLIEQKAGGFIQDIHDGAIADSLYNGKSGIAKKVYSTTMGLALLFMTISGFYLWYKPKQLKNKKNNR